MWTVQDLQDWSFQESGLAAWEALLFPKMVEHIMARPLSFFQDRPSSNARTRQQAILVHVNA